MTRRTLALLVAVLAVLATLATIGALAVRGGGDDQAPQGQVVDSDPAFKIGSRATPYRIVYRLDDLSDRKIAPTTDQVWVRQPFESRLETSSGEGDGGELQSVQIAAIDRLRLGTLDEPLIIARVPGLAVSDLRVSPMLDDAVAAGLIERREQRVVAGRRCQVVRSGTLLGAGPLVPITDREHADSCIDAEGLMLEETLYSDGKPTLHRLAIEVDTSPALAADLFDVGAIVIPVDKGAGSSLPVDPDVGALGPFWVLSADDLPGGFERVGRFSIIPPQPDRFATPGNPAIVAGTADVFVSDADMIVLYQGGTAGGVVAFPPTPHAASVDGDALGRGEAVLSALANELHFPQPHGKFVHVIGTLPIDDLVALARHLVETEGTGLVYLHD